ncbi:MAG: hypothetical protein ACRYHB_05475 [Janthinobacterium lividum]
MLKSVSVARSATALLLAFASLVLTGCGARPYKTTENQFAGRPVPPSKLTQRVMVAVAQTGASNGQLELLDAKRDIRANVYTANSTFTISGFAGNAMQVISYPEQLRGFVLSTDGSVQTINYSTEASLGTTATSAGIASSFFVPADTQAVYSAVERTGNFVISAPASGSATSTSLGTTYNFAVPSVYKVVANPAHTVVLLMLRNSNMVYRLLFLNSNQTPPAGSLTCQPLNKPVYCILPVGASQSDGSVSEPAFHRPVDAYFAPDGSQVYFLSCGRECGGTAANGDDAPGLNFANLNTLRVDYYPTSATYVSPVVSTTAVPGGATTALSDGTTVYVAGQSLQSDNLYSGNLSLIPLSTKTVSTSFPISDGTHNKLLFADNNTLWIGASNCASGERAAHSGNPNCLTRYDITGKTAAIIPAVSLGTSQTVPYPNENLDQYYYGSLTGLCWVEGLNKVYTAYGGQVHAFNTADGSEINNINITVQGTANDVSYIDASTNVAN